MQSTAQIPPPELLAPAGTREALDAAIRAGADAVYFGGSRFNARMFAGNFDDDALHDAIAACAFYGVKSNITLNTLYPEREHSDVLRFAEQLLRWGADAVICADLGIASLLHRYFPELILHASTQCAGHNTDAARFFASRGFSRMVCARELSYENVKTLCRTSPIETELFIHGALCVSQSGGCLFSSAVGGRSGNRGACAQPCRLPYALSCQNEKTPKRPPDADSEESYPLSLKDLSLSGQIPALLSLGAASFKIEGRMKGPAYVEGVVRIFRRLIDEKRNADKQERAMLAALFSRGGAFTDDYFRGVSGAGMRGIRTEADKNATLRAEKEITGGRPAVRRIPCDITCEMRAGEPAILTLAFRKVPMPAAQNALTPDVQNLLLPAENTISVRVTGPIPNPATARPTTEDDIRAAVSKLGSTPFQARNIRITADDGLSLPLSAWNAMRRDAAEQLEQRLRICASAPRIIRKQSDVESLPPIAPYSGAYAYPRQASFLFPARIPKEAKAYYDILYVPLEVFDGEYACALRAGVNGVLLPPVIFDSERARIFGMLERACQAGISHVLISNPGHIALVKEVTAKAASPSQPVYLHGGLRLNLWSAESANVYFDSGFSDVIVSPELRASQIADLHSKMLLPHGVITYGRLPLMTLQRCIIREYTDRRPAGRNARGILPAEMDAEHNSCTLCDKNPISYLTDRKNIRFPVTRAFGHRNIVWNSVPIYMADKASVLEGLHTAFSHHIFTTETDDEIRAIVSAYRDSAPQGIPFPGFGAYRRIPT